MATLSEQVDMNMWSMTRPQQQLVKLKNSWMVKLERSNYFTWKAQIRTHLRGINLLSFVEQVVNKEDALQV